MSAEGASLLVVTVLGCAVGSFLNVVVHRVPRGLSLVRPGSSCPSCAAPVRAYDNVPVLSWLALGGRCRQCREPISWRYPVVEAVTGALFLLEAATLGWSPYLAAVLVVSAAGVALFLIDLAHRRLPFAVTGTAAALVAGALAVDVLVDGASPLPGAVASALVWLAVYGGVWLLTSGRGMGLGDVALAPLLGLVLGWSGWGPSTLGLFGGFVLGAAVGAVLLLGGRASRRTRVPHGPFMLAGAAVGLFWGAPLWHGYLSLFGL